jgi:hypothetical protein
MSEFAQLRITSRGALVTDSIWFGTSYDFEWDGEGDEIEVTHLQMADLFPYSYFQLGDLIKFGHNIYLRVVKEYDKVKFGYNLHILVLKRETPKPWKDSVL